MRILSSSANGIAVAVLALVAGGARDNGCLDLLIPPDDSGCPEVLCDVACPGGHVLDENGCATCACESATCAADADCASGYACDTEHFCETDCRDGEACDMACRGRCVAAEPAPAGCWSDSDCAAGSRCDLVNYCDLPPGCDPGEACPAVCYGRCVSGDVDAGEPDACVGAWLNEFGDCLGPVDQMLPPECCRGQQGPCGDGSEVVCDMAPPACGPGQVAVVRNGCYACVDAATCGFPPPPPPCGDGSELACRMMVPDCGPDRVVAVIAGCYECVDPATCAPSECRPVACALYCEFGFQRDPATGCEICACNEAPPGCTEEYAPVCGVDGTTYPNACHARLAGVGIAHRGECATSSCLPLPCDVACEHGHVLDAQGCPTCECREEPPACLPVACNLYCEYGFRLDAAGCETCACNEAPPACTEEYDPVCGVDGTTYPNGCHARVAGVGIAHRGACASCEIACLVYEPVCGTDGVTYDCGAADAECHGVRVAYAGECRPTTPSGCATDAECAWGQKCVTRTDASGEVAGRCVDAEWCAAPSDCANLSPVVDCVGHWTCNTNRCAFVCGG